jgi:hypothetical protein
MPSRGFKFFGIEIKVATSAARWVFPIFILGGLVMMSDIQTEYDERFLIISALTEIVFPLGAMIFANSLILPEREAGTLAFVAVRIRLPRLWLRRLGELLLIETLCLVSLLLIYRYFYIQIPLDQLLFGSVSVSFALIGATSLVGLLFKEMTAGYLIGTLWWGLCLIGRRSAYLFFGSRGYLFYSWFCALENIPPDNWLQNKLTLFTAGLVMILLCAFLLRRPERLTT